MEEPRAVIDVVFGESGRLASIRMARQILRWLDKSVIKDASGAQGIIEEYELF